MKSRLLSLAALVVSGVVSLATSEPDPTVRDSALIGEFALNTASPAYPVTLGITLSDDIRPQGFVEFELRLSVENHGTESVQVKLYEMDAPWDGLSTPADGASGRSDFTVVDGMEISGALGEESETAELSLLGYTELGEEDEIHLLLWLEGDGDLTGEGTVQVYSMGSEDEDVESWIKVEVL